jgi:SAM-dependent methyltransferase
MRRHGIADRVVLGGRHSGYDLEVFEETDGQVIEGLLRPKGEPATWYPIEGGVPCFLRGALRPERARAEFAERHGLPLDAPLPAAREDGEVAEDAEAQRRTNVTFSDKWRRFRTYGLAPSHQEFLFDWYVKKLGLGDLDALRAFHASHARTLEVGPGSGFNTRFMAECAASNGGEVFAADISDAALTSYENTRSLSNCCVVQADLMDLPFADGAFDFIIADGVLHHTPDTKQALFALARKLRPGGEMFFYVYKKMGAARQFADAHLRAAFSGLAPEDCYRACEGLTELGQQLSRLGAKITLTRPIPALGIPEGTHDVQRLLYYNFLKCFWNEAFDFETNNMVNFDWYHPHNAWQHTEDEVRGWLRELNVERFSFHPANPNGLSVRFVRKRAPSA